MLKRKNIWFHCPACEKKLVIGAEAAGMRAECPECGKRIPIPDRSTAMPNWVKSAGLIGGQALMIILALVIGWQYARSHTSHPAVTKPPPDAEVEQAVGVESTRTAETEPTVNEVNGRLLNEHVELQGRYNRMIQWMLDNYRGKYPLPERLVERLRISPMTEADAVHPDLVELLNMTDDEKVMVQDIFVYVRDSFKTAEMERARVTDRQKDRITFAIPHYPEVGMELKEDLYLALETTLGTPRFDRMMDVSGQELREQFHYFGEASRTLTFEIIRPQKPGDHPPYILIRDGWVIPEGESVRLTKITETAVMDTLPITYEAYTDMLPETMLQPAATP